MLVCTCKTGGLLSPVRRWNKCNLFSYKSLSAILLISNQAAWLRQQVCEQFLALLAVPACSSFPCWSAACNGLLLRSGVCWVYNLNCRAQRDELWVYAVGFTKQEGRHWCKATYVVCKHRATHLLPFNWAVSNQDPCPVVLDEDAVLRMLFQPENYVLGGQHAGKCGCVYNCKLCGKDKKMHKMMTFRG